MKQLFSALIVVAALATSNSAQAKQTTASPQCDALYKKVQSALILFSLKKRTSTAYIFNRTDGYFASIGCIEGVRDTTRLTVEHNDNLRTSKYWTLIASGFAALTGLTSKQIGQGYLACLLDKHDVGDDFKFKGVNIGICTTEALVIYLY